MIAHRATLDVSRALVHHVARLLRDERRRLGTPKGTRALTPFWQAVLVLRWFRGESDIPKLGRDHRVSRATAYRYISEGIDVLAAQAPDLHEALDRAHADGLAYVILDGTLIPIDRCSEQAISVKGEPNARNASVKARHTARPVARTTALAITQNRPRHEGQGLASLVSPGRVTVAISSFIRHSLWREAA